MTLRQLTLTIVVLLTQPALCCAQEKKAWWNPFSSGGAASAKTIAPDDSPVRSSKAFGGDSKLKLPAFQLPSWSEKAKAAPKSKKPSTLTRMGSTSKRWWNNTVDFVNPFDSKPATKSQGYQPQLQTESKSGSGMFGWMWREEKTETPETVNDFLRQPRPRF